MISDTLDRLLASLVLELHSASICIVGQECGLAFAPFEAITIHHVLHGSGHVQVGNAVAQPYGPGNIIVVPPRQAHVVRSGAGQVREVSAEDHCGPFADGLAAFTVGSGPGTLLLCGSIPPAHGRALSLFDLLAEPVMAFPDGGRGEGLLALMREEVSAPGLGTAAITEALMKASLVTLVRDRIGRGPRDLLPAALLGDPRVARAALEVIEKPGLQHTVGSLADRAGMSRASFADHFARSMGSGPMEFVQAVRLRAAARLLETTDLPLKVIAAAVGYQDPSSFSRAFRSVHGLDPTAYRGRRDPTWGGA